MANMQPVEVRGLQQLEANLQALNYRVARQAVGHALKVAAQPWRQQAEAMAPYDPNHRASKGKHLKESIVTKTKIRPNRGTGYTVVGPERIKGASNQTPGAYGLMVEVGTKPHSLGKGSNLRQKKQSGAMHPGAAPHPYLRPAYESRKDEVFNIFADVLRTEIESKTS